MSEDVSQGLQSTKKEVLDPQKFRILVVEDDKAVSRLMKASLTMIPDVRVEFLDSGEDAVDMLRRAQEEGAPFNLVVTDLGLREEMTGFDVAAVIRDEFLSPHVVLFSGSATEIGDRYSPEQLRERGVNYLMGKPFSPVAFIQYVQRLKNPQT